MDRMLNEFWQRSAERTQSMLKSLYADAAGEPQRLLFEAMDYSLQAGGKRLRPLLCHLFCEACGAPFDRADHAAAAVEMIHTYSLIHDDLPAMDNDDFRRGKPTSHKVYGEAMAILAGDGLQTDAFRVLAMAPLPPERVVSCLRLLSECAGPYGMVGGQVLDMEAERRECTEREVLDIQSRKTGALIRAACEMGVVSGAGTDAQRSAARAYAEAVGLAFQIRDDMLDVIGDSARLGKQVGKDENKNTFVRLYGVEKCQKLVTEYTEQALRALEEFDEPGLLNDLAVYLSNRDH